MANLTFDLSTVTDSDKVVRKKLGEIERLRERAIDAGIDPALTKPRENLFMRALNFIDKPKQMVQGLIDSAFIRGDLNELTPGGFLQDSRAAIDRALEERQNGFDLLRRAGVESPIARTVGGFGIELLTDPLVLLGGASKTAARQGGLALTNIGAKKVKSKIASLLPALDNTDDLLHVSGQVNDALRSFKKASKITNNLDFLAKKPNLTHFQQVQKRFLEKELSILSPKYEGMFNLADDLDMFADKGLAARLELPFVGNLIHPTKPGKEAGILGQLFNPLKLKQDIFTVSPKGGVKILGKQFSENAKPQWIHEVELSVAGAMNSLQEFLSPATNALGGSAVGRAAGKVKEAGKILKEGLSRSFARKFFVGDLVDNTLKEHNATKAGLQVKSYNKFMKTFPEFSQEGGEQLLKRTTLAIDEGNKAFIKNGLLKQMRDTASKDDIVRLETELAKWADDPTYTTNTITDLIDEMFSGQDEVFESLKEANRRFIIDSADDEVKPLAERAMMAFDEMFEREVKYGVRDKKSSFFSAYIPHAYKNLDSVKGRVRTNLKRKHLSFDDAFFNSGLDAETDLRKLFEGRYYASELAINQKRYANRAILEASLPADTYRKLVIEGLDDTDPIAQKAAQRILSDHDLPLPADISALDLEKGVEGRKIGELLDEALPDNLKSLDDPQAKIEVLKRIGQSDNEFRQILRKAGFKPLDSELPQGLNGEIAKIVKIGDEERILPVGIADAIEETIYQKDIIKQALKGSPALTKMLSFADSSINHMKLFVTQLWPAYWSQNMISDRLFDIMDKGISAVDPGQWTRTAKLLDGTGELITNTGEVITAKQFNQWINDLGINYSLADMTEFAGGFAATDIEKIARKSKGTALTNVAKGNIKLGLEQAGDYMRRNFENFYRVNSFAYHLKRGSGLADAARISQEALLDYRQLTNFEQSVARRFYMFYGWISKSTQKTLKSYFLSPGDLQLQLAAAKSIQEAFSAPDALPTFEEYDKRMLDSMLSTEQLSVPLGHDKDGKKLTGRLRGLPLNTVLENFTAQMPRSMNYKEIIDTFSDSAHRTMQKQFAAANPFIKVPLEKLAGKSFYFDRDIDSTFLRRIPSIEAAAKKLAPHKYDKIPKGVYDALDAPAKEFFNGTPDGKGFIVVEPSLLWTAVNFYPPLTRLSSTLGGLADEKIPLSQALLKTISGIKVDSSDPEKLAVYDELNQLRQLHKEQNIKLKEENNKSNLDFSF